MLNISTSKLKNAWIAILLGLLFSLPGKGLLGAEPILLDQILVVVNGQPVTRSQVDFYRAFLVAMKGRGLGWPKNIEGPSRLSPQEMLDIVIVDELLFEGASRVEALRVREPVLEQRTQDFKKAFETEAAYDAFVAKYEMSSDVMREFFSRRLRVEGYIALNVATGRPTEKELREYYGSHPLEFEGRSFDEARAEIEDQLYSERVTLRFDRWVAELKERARVSIPVRASGR